MSEDVYIIGAGMTKFGKHLDKGVKALTGESLKLALADCNLTMDDLEAAWFSNSGWGLGASAFDPRASGPDGQRPRAHLHYQRGKRLCRRQHGPALGLDSC